METSVSPGQQFSSRLTSNSLVQALGTLLSFGIGFFTFAIVTRGLGPSAYGDYAAAGVLIFVLVALVDSGLTSVVVREISASPQRTEAVMRTSLSLRGILAAAIALTIVAIALIAPWNERMRIALLIGSVGSIGTMVSAGIVPVLQARLKLGWIVVANVTGRLVTLALTAASLALDFGFAGIVWATVAGIAVTVILNVVVVSRFVSLRPTLDVAAWRQLARTSLTLGIALGLTQAYFRIDTLLLALLRPQSEVGLYGAAYKFVELSGMVVSAVSITVLPTLSRFIATNDPRSRALIQRAFEVTLATGLPLMILLAVFADDILLLTSGREFAEAASSLRVLSLYIPMAFVGSLIWTILIAAGKDRLLLVFAMSLLTLNILLNVLLVPRFGYEAAAYAAVASEASALLAGAFLIRRIQGLLPTARYLGILLPALAVMALVALWLPAPWLLGAAAALVLYSAVVFVVPGTMNEVARNIFRFRFAPRGRG